MKHCWRYKKRRSIPKKKTAASTPLQEPSEVEEDDDKEDAEEDEFTEQEVEEYVAPAKATLRTTAMAKIAAGIVVKDKKGAKGVEVGILKGTFSFYSHVT